MNQSNRRVIERIKQNARGDARSMGVSYASRLDAHAAAMALGNWSNLQHVARSGHEIEDGIMLLARGSIGDRIIHVDAEFAMKLQSDETIDVKAAYQDMLDETINIAALDEAISRPRGDNAEDDYRLRRDVATRAFWRGAGGLDVGAQSTAEMIAVMAHLASDPRIHDEMHAAGVMPPLWIGRAPSPYMIRDMLLYHEAYETTPVGGEDQTKRAHGERWWQGLSMLIARHLPLGVSGWLHSMLDGTYHCGHEGCGHDHGHGADTAGRGVSVMLAFERIDHVCDAIEPPAPPDDATAEKVRVRYEDAMCRRRAERRGGRPADHADVVKADVDDFLQENDRDFGDPCWHWDAGMARRFADVAMDNEDAAAETS